MDSSDGWDDGVGGRAGGGTGVELHLVWLLSLEIQEGQVAACPVKWIASIGSCGWPRIIRPQRPTIAIATAPANAKKCKQAKATHCPAP